MQHYVRSNKIATRVSYGNALVELAKEHDDVYVLDADLAVGQHRLQSSKKEFPEHHIDCGIAECNMIGIAAEALPQPVKFRLQVRLPCLQQDVHLSRCETLSDIRT